MKRLLAASPYIVFALYLIGVYPFPERFPFLSNPAVALILLLMILFYWNLEYRHEQNRNKKIALLIRNILFLLIGINLFFFPGQYFFSDTFSFFNRGLGSPILAIILTTLPEWPVFETTNTEYS